MLTITGEVRKVLETSYYTDKRTGELIPQAVIIIEPDAQRQNYEVNLKRSQLKPKTLERWRSLKGQIVSVPVSLFVSYKHQFYKFNALGSGEPIQPNAA